MEKTPYDALIEHINYYWRDEAWKEAMIPFETGALPQKNPIDLSDMNLCEGCKEKLVIRFLGKVIL